MNLKNKLKKIYILLFALVFSFIGFFNFNYCEAKADTGISVEILKDDELILSQVRQIIKDYYIGSVSDEVLNCNNIEDMIKGINDPYAAYFTKEQFEKFQGYIDNKFCGIGAYIEVVDEGVKVTDVVEGSPAAIAGIKSDDIIIKADNNSLVGLSSNEALEYIKGKENTKVKITVKRGGDLLEFQVTRKLISLHTVKSKVLENKIGYIQISSFGEDTPKEFRVALNDLSKKDINSYVVDLRDNTGGYLLSALDIGGYFVGDNPMILMDNKKKNRVTYYGMYHKNVIDKPVVFLVNDYTASASEVLSAAIKDYKKAFIIGKKTYGKGVAQNIFHLSDDSRIKVTTNKFLSPLGKEINHIGITPDFIVKDDYIDYLSFGKLLLSGYEKEGSIEALKNKDDYIKLILDENIFYIKKSTARCEENWKAFQYIINNVSNNNILIGKEDRWVKYSQDFKMEDILYPESKSLREVSKKVGDRGFEIVFNNIVDMDSVDASDIEVIDFSKGKRGKVTVNKIENSKKVSVTLDKGFEKGTYYIVVNNKGIKDIKGRKLAKKVIVKCNVKS